MAGRQGWHLVSQMPRDVKPRHLARQPPPLETENPKGGARQSAGSDCPSLRSRSHIEGVRHERHLNRHKSFRKEAFVLGPRLVHQGAIGVSAANLQEHFKRRPPSSGELTYETARRVKWPEPIDPRGGSAGAGPFGNAMVRIESSAREICHYAITRRAGRSSGCLGNCATAGDRLRRPPESVRWWDSFAACAPRASRCFPDGTMPRTGALRESRR
jgi:hypothetical protein